MTAHEHAALLFKEANNNGMDAPSEDMVSDALNSAMDNATLDCIMALREKGFGQAAEYLHRLERRMWSGDKTLHKLPRK